MLIWRSVIAKGSAETSALLGRCLKQETTFGTLGESPEAQAAVCAAAFPSLLHFSGPTPLTESMIAPLYVEILAKPYITPPPPSTKRKRASKDPGTAHGVRGLCPSLLAVSILELHLLAYPAGLAMMFIYTTK